MIVKRTSIWTHGVALSGAESSGKSTLLEKVEPFLDVPVSRGIVRGVLGSMGLSVPPSFGVDLQLARAFQEELQSRRESTERGFGGPFISDRTSLDSFAYTLAVCGRDAFSQEWLNLFHKQCIDYATQMYQFIFILPTGKFPLKEDGVRNTLPFNALMMHYLIEGITRESGIPYHVIQKVDLNERVDEVLATLKSFNFITGG